MAAANHNTVGLKGRPGEAGEDIAVACLRRLGYHIICRNYRCAYGEIDVIATHKDTVVFIEVKSRSGSHFGRPEGAVTEAKKRKLSQVAWHYLQEHGLTDQRARFDVVAVDDLIGRPQVTIFENAFESTY